MRLNKIFIVVSLIILGINKINATAQTPDYLIIEKDTLKLHCNPLESFFEKNPLPDNTFKTISSGLWRGYIAYFKIKNNKLIVENIYKIRNYTDDQGTPKEELISIYNIAFKDIKDFECNFYNGVLICPLGEILEYVHMSYSSVYEKYSLFEIKDGNYIKERLLSNQEFIDLKLKHFQKYKESEEYKKKLEETINYYKEAEIELEKEYKDIKKENNKKRKQNKYLYEKEKELEYLKSAEGFLFFFTTNNIKTIDLTN
jgi:hypothetical protein